MYATAPRWRQAARSPAPSTSRAACWNSAPILNCRPTTRISPRTRTSFCTAAPAAAPRSPARCSRTSATRRSSTWAASRTGPTLAAQSTSDGALAQKFLLQLTHACVALEGEHLGDRGDLCLDAGDAAFGEDATESRLHGGYRGAEGVVAADDEPDLAQGSD